MFKQHLHVAVRTAGFSVLICCAWTHREQRCFKFTLSSLSRFHSAALLRTVGLHTPPVPALLPLVCCCYIIRTLYILSHGPPDLRSKRSAVAMGIISTLSALLKSAWSKVISPHHHHHHHSSFSCPSTALLFLLSKMEKKNSYPLFW